MQYTTFIKKPNYHNSNKTEYITYNANALGDGLTSSEIFSVPLHS